MLLDSCEGGKAIRKNHCVYGPLPVFIVQYYVSERNFPTGSSRWTETALHSQGKYL